MQYIRQGMKKTSFTNKVRKLKTCFKAYFEKLHSQPQVNTVQKIDSLFKSLNY